jgi:hypothetical protein
MTIARQDFFEIARPSLMKKCDAVSHAAERRRIECPVAHFVCYIHFIGPRGRISRRSMTASAAPDAERGFAATHCISVRGAASPRWSGVVTAETRSARFDSLFPFPCRSSTLSPCNSICCRAGGSMSFSKTRSVMAHAWRAAAAMVADLSAFSCRGFGDSANAAIGTNTTAANQARLRDLMLIALSKKVPFVLDEREAECKQFREQAA